MARIPASRVLAHEAAPTSLSPARVFKAVSVSNDSPRMIPGPRPESPVPEPPAVRPVPEARPTGDHVAPGQLEERLAAAERRFERRLTAEIQSAEERGYARGMAEGQAASEENIRSQKEASALAAEGFAAAWDSFSSNSEPLLAELAFRMAESILESPLPEGIRALSTTALTEALEKLGDARSVHVTLHPADYMMLDESGVLLPLIRNHPNMSWKTDAGLDRGDWEARTDAALVRRVGRELLEDMKDNLLFQGGE